MAPNSNAKSSAGYNPPDFESKIRLDLSRNETVSTLPDDQSLARIPPEAISKYPSMLELQNAIGGWLDVAPDRIVVSAGGDDSLDRAVRLSLQSSATEILSHAPSFEMVEVYTRNHGGRINNVVWQSGPFPTDEFTAQISTETAIAIVVSPNNPTGLTIPLDEILRIADAAKTQGIFLLVDNAYVEFANEDPSEQLFAHPNILVLRTFSKAWGLAGLRTGFLVAPSADTAARFRSAAGPFPVSGVSLKICERAIANSSKTMARNVAQIKHFRNELVQLLLQSNVEATPSEGNFLLATFPSAADVCQKLADQGIATRKFPNSAFLKNSLRITVPTNAADFLHLAKSLASILEHDFDLGKFAVGDEAENSSARSTCESPRRVSTVQRKTKETDIEIELNIDGTGKTTIDTGIGFLDHMLTALAFHSRFDLKLRCQGDLHIDDHHTAEDCALALGTAIDQALGPRTGIIRFGYAYAPLDEALARTVIDLSGRPWPSVNLALNREMVGTIATENLTHVFNSLAMALKCSLHVDVLRGDNDHHKAEAAFKSLALALRKAVQRSSGDVPSTKGVL